MIKHRPAAEMPAHTIRLSVLMISGGVPEVLDLPKPPKKPGRLSPELGTARTAVIPGSNNRTDTADIMLQGCCADAMPMCTRPVTLWVRPAPAVVRSALSDRKLNDWGFAIDRTRVAIHG